MAYAPGRGYGQAPRGTPQPQNYHYENEQGGNGYGYEQDGNYDNTGYGQGYSEPHHGRARYVDPGPTPQQPRGGVITPQTSYITEDYGGGHQRGQSYGQQQSYDGGNQYGGYQQQSRPPPQRPGHATGPPPQGRGQGQGPPAGERRPMNDRPPPTRQYDTLRPSTSGASSSRQHDPQYNASGAKPRPGHRDRILPNSPHSPQTMAWDNPFGSFGQPESSDRDKPQSKEGPRPATADGRHANGPRQSSESSRSQHQQSRQQQQQQYHEQHPMPNNGGHSNGPVAPYDEHGRSASTPAYQQNQYPPQRNPSASSSTPTPTPPNQARGAAPNFSRVQSPPVRNQYTPPQIAERSNTMPSELPSNGFAGQARIGTPPTFGADLPFREGRAQTPVYASPQYAEAQSAVIETASDPPTAASEWTDAPAHDSYHEHNSHSRLAPDTRASHDQPSAHSSYGEFFDDYYDSRHSHNSHTNEMDMPNFGNDKGNDELHLGGATTNNASPQTKKTAYGGGPQQHGPQDQGYGYSEDNHYGQGPAEPAYGGYQQYGQGAPPNQQRLPPQQYGRGGGRGMPPPRGMPPRGRGYPGPQDRSVSAGPGPRPYGGPPPPNGRGMPQRGRGGPGGPMPYGGDSRGPPTSASAPPGGPPGGPGGPGGPPPSRGRGGPPRGGGRGRGNPDSLPHHPVPMRPGLMQQNGSQAPPAPVRQYNASNPAQPPNQYRAPSISEGTPVTHAELQKLRMAVQDNPGDQKTTFALVKKLVDASTTLVNEGTDQKAKAKSRERYIDEAYKLLKKLVGYNNQDAMFYMAECYGSGSLGLAKDPKEAFLLYQSAAKLNHAPSAYRVAVCCELGENEGGGTKRDPLKAMQWYRRAATLQDLPAMYKLGVILLKGLLGQNAQAGEAVTWLQRAADRADAENPHALHELGLLYENPPPHAANNVIPDLNYSLELFQQAAGLGYKFSQYRLGQAYEYGQLNCAIDARQSIAWYSKAAVQEEHQSELALSGWYLTGSESIIQQSDTEAYLWARKAAQAGLAKAEYAMGYFTETGIGCSANLEDAKRWYWRAASQNFPKARERLEDLRKGGARAQGRVSRTAMTKQQGDCRPM